MFHDLVKAICPSELCGKFYDVLLDVVFAEVDLRPPAGCEPLSAKVWAVYARNDHIEWMLLTTAPVMTFDDAVNRVEWYSGRWGIEVYHRTLKTAAGLRTVSLVRQTASKHV